MLDDIDIKILNVLQQQGRTKRNVLSEIVGLSVPSVSERLKKLEEQGIIEGYYAKVNKHSFGLDITAYIQVLMESSKHYKDLIVKVDKNPQILECHSVLGDGSHLLKVVVKNTAALEKLLTVIQSWPGVTSTKTNFVLSTIKETTAISI
ncbi:Lrp/AsnC family transcriptional regulator [bacterium BMS3Abin03]|nr:Lrp/AsnC family transcriptional regulator [bacterium BMS3Abin03]MCG6959401.1 Lrp/AsnC family transcriptional regulator [bacterium BMS3Abin03]